jgi:hypothetical protein
MSDRSVARQVGVVLLVLGMATPALARRINETPYEFRYEARISAGLSIEIKGVNGDLTVEESEGSEVEVVARKTGEFDDPSEVKMSVVEHDRGATICAVYPSGSKDAAGVCAAPAGDSPTLGGSDVKVDFLVRVPRGVRFVGRTANGKVQAHRVSGGVEAHTVNGNIDIEGSGPAHATSVNGSIHAIMQAGQQQESQLQTVNGNLTLTLASLDPARLFANTTNGGIDMQFPVSKTVEESAHHLVAQLGGERKMCQPVIRMRTVNGDIRLEYQR